MRNYGKILLVCMGVCAFSISAYSAADDAKVSRVAAAGQFTTLQASGDTSLSGNLSVAGSTSLASLTAGTTALGSTTATTVTTGSLNVTGQTVFANGFTTQGPITGQNGCHFHGGSRHESLVVDGRLNVNETAYLADATVGGRLTSMGRNTLGHVTVSDKLLVSGQAHLCGDVTASKDVHLNGAVTIGENLSVGDDAHVAGNVEIDGKLNINDDFTVGNDGRTVFNIDNESGNTIVHKTLSVHDGLVVGDETRGHEEVLFWVGGPRGKTEIKKDAHIHGDLHVNGDTTIGDKFIVTHHQEEDHRGGEGQDETLFIVDKHDGTKVHNSLEVIAHDCHEDFGPKREETKEGHDHHDGFHEDIMLLSANKEDGVTVFEDFTVRGDWHDRSVEGEAQDRGPGEERETKLFKVDQESGRVTIAKDARVGGSLKIGNHFGNVLAENKCGGRYEIELADNGETPLSIDVYTLNYHNDYQVMKRGSFLVVPSDLDDQNKELFAFWATRVSTEHGNIVTFSDEENPAYETSTNTISGPDDGETHLAPHMSAHTRDEGRKLHIHIKDCDYSFINVVGRVRHIKTMRNEGGQH